MDFSDKSGVIYTDEKDGIGYLVLNRPEKRNAMLQAMWEAIPNAVVELDANPNVRVIIVTGSSDKAFCAGADLEELEGIATSAERRESNRLAIRNAQRSLARAKKPTIAQIWGACVGGGCGLAIHCDMRFAARGAKFGITPAKLGLVYPLNDTKQLVDLVGPSKARSILFSARKMDVDEAERIGLIDMVFEPNELEEETLAFAQQISKQSQYSVRMMKTFIQRVLDGQVDDDEETANIFGDAHEGMDATEGVRAFLEKRVPVFKWTGEE
ncbi:enoyl-CoA hydratase/isomerase family protein [Kordiimonas laminariae]|uniref:enoyl-CoA hydratase/isomerase family protein n=1 Tax=Kordiimonas laminariae TaxID=2917717 RepID=UPI001FF6D44F|nr:enoyl-CoA hydratase-related protein [Kordiimonas laminariae]MCK0068600.1 enoyl-CoA hydratase-related protein [Kordiimonas laminariae]